MEAYEAVLKEQAASKTKLQLAQVAQRWKNNKISQTDLLSMVRTAEKRCQSALESGRNDLAKGAQSEDTRRAPSLLTTFDFAAVHGLSIARSVPDGSLAFSPAVPRIFENCHMWAEGKAALDAAKLFGNSFKISNERTARETPPM